MVSVQKLISILQTDEKSKIIVKNLIQLASNLKIDVICEGVETNDQNELLVSYGADIIQGYLIGKAVSFSEAKIIAQK